MDVKGAGRQAVDWTYLAQNGDKWPAVVNTVMNHHKYIHTHQQLRYNCIR